jgi:hypothetical protein
MTNYITCDILNIEGTYISISLPVDIKEYYIPEDVSTESMEEISNE